MDNHSRDTSKGRILVTGMTLPIVEELLSPFGQVEVTRNTDEQSLIALMKGTIAVIARGMTQISGSVIHAGKDLRVIGRTGSGYDSIDVEAATGRRIPVVYAPGAGARAVAEGTLCMILACAKRLKEFDIKMVHGEWEARERFAPGDLEGAVLGIVGLGRIGREVARLAKNFGMRILTYDPLISPQTAEQSGAELVQLNELFAKSDFISLHAPSNKQTRGMINRERLRGVKKGVVLINLARGGLLESLDVLDEFLANGRLSAVGLDVYPEEPPDTSHPIFRRPNVIYTPHVMGLSRKAAHATFAAVSEGMAAVLRGKIPANVVNPEVFGVRNH
jgi:D-3-phosphoglycerate dehydrogenase / 2-oxoglutarate reductase